MRLSYIIFMTVLLVETGLITLQAQEAVSAAGCDYSGGGGALCFTLGQVACSTHIGTTGSAVQGVQHPYDISLVNTTDIANSSMLSVLAFPNPAADLLILQVEKPEVTELAFRLYDASGILLESRKIESCETFIEMGGLSPAVYYLDVYNKFQIVKALRIIKH